MESDDWRDGYREEGKASKIESKAGTEQEGRKVEEGREGGIGVSTWCGGRRKNSRMVRIDEDTVRKPVCFYSLKIERK